MSRPSPARPQSTNPALLGRIGRTCYRHRWLTLLTWIVGVACLITLWTRFGAPAQDNFAGSDPGQTQLNEHFQRQSGDSLTLAIRSSGSITSPAVRARVTSALTPFERAAHVTEVSNPYQVPGQISSDGHIAFATVQFNVASTKIPNSEALALMNDARVASGHGVTFRLGGDVVDLAETPYGGPTEGIGIGAAAIVLLIAFGSLLAMGLPVLTAVLGIGAGLSLIALLGHVVPAPSFSPIIASMIGLGVGVDYALFIVTRFREALRGAPESRSPGLAGRAGAGPEDAAAAAMRTAGRTVLIAGTTVVIGMLGLLVLRQSLLNGVAVAAAATVAMTMLASLTLLPALLGFTGTRLAKPSKVRRPRWLGGRRAPRSGPPAAERWAGVIQRRPVIAAVVSTGVILALAAPALGMKLNMPDESSQARGTMGYQSYAIMAEGFGPGFDAPLVVAAALPSPGASTARLAAAIRATPGVAHVTPVQVSKDGEAAMLIAYPTTGEQNSATNALVNRMRDSVLPQATAGTGIRAYLTGPNAGGVAFANLIGQRLPLLIGVVVALSMLLLLVMFRSVTIAVKAAVMNLLSISAAYGVLVAVVQDGVLGRLFGFPEKMPVTTWVPMFLFVILFGLSMDYEVFLLSRIREEYDATGDNARSVARGLARTARVITAAAAIMVVVFLSFVLGADVAVKQIGLGLAVAVLIDATLVRMVLVPAVMELLGKANWWLPAPLARILPKTSLMEDEPPAEVRVRVTAAE
ncbi:MAG: putative drug exporter of the superfamily [Streptosporangiaceae bacterium]|nr:putative drug exporter of the superfamily [Streptosporangiaceae bacterium]